MNSLKFFNWVVLYWAFFNVGFISAMSYQAWLHGNIPMIIMMMGFVISNLYILQKTSAELEI